jgi:hypothetical protein
MGIGMNKTKVALSILTIVITIGPLLGVVLVYRDNLIGLVLPPSTPGMSGITNSDLNISSFENINPIQPIGDPTYNAVTGALDYPFNFTNPLPNDISIDDLSADIFASDGTKLGTISINNPINVAPGESAVVDIKGNMDPQLIQQYQDQLAQGNIQIENLNVTVGGITLHIDNLSQFIGGDNNDNNNSQQPPFNNGNGNYQPPNDFPIPTPKMVQPGE